MTVRAWRSIVEREIDSPDVASFAGSDAGRSRFRLATRLDVSADDLKRARLRVDLDSGNAVLIDLGGRMTTRRLHPRADRELVMRFESPGDNCEIGLMRREVGSERLSLLRYGGSRNADRLIEAIDNGFEGFATEADLMMTPLPAPSGSRRAGATA